MQDIMATCAGVKLLSLRLLTAGAGLLPLERAGALVGTADLSGRHKKTAATPPGVTGKRCAAAGHRSQYPVTPDSIQPWGGAFLTPLLTPTGGAVPLRQFTIQAWIQPVIDTGLHTDNE
jgi:hypothetical protein